MFHIMLFNNVSAPIRQLHRIYDEMNDALTYAEGYFQILDAIKEARTTVVISHSISQIIDADIIFVLREGRVVEHGTHEELYESDGTYREIFDASARSLNLDKISKALDADFTSNPAH